MIDGECPDVPYLEETCCVVAGRVRKSHRALGAHPNVRLSQQLRRLKILSALDLSRSRARWGEETSDGAHLVLRFLSKPVTENVS